MGELWLIHMWVKSGWIRRFIVGPWVSICVLLRGVLGHQSIYVVAHAGA